MDVTGINPKAYKFGALGAEEEIAEETPEEQSTEQTKAKEYGVSKKEKKDKDTVELSSSDLSDADVEEKAINYLKNILFVTNLTEQSRAELSRYYDTFDAASFIKSYGPFSSTAEISAAMFAATSKLIKTPDDDV